MIEDALKSIRNIHRIYIAVAFITLVFSLSIGEPDDKREQINLINQITSLNFNEYDVFVGKKIKETSSKQFTKLSNELKSAFERESLNIINLNDLYKLFEQSSHIGKISVAEGVLSNISNATLNQLAAINSLPINKNVQIVVPDIDSIKVALIEDLLPYNQSDVRISEAQITVDDHYGDNETFLPSSTTSSTIYFELHDTVRSGGAPVFNISFPSKVVTIEGTSFIEWFSEATKDLEVASFKNKKIHWLPTFENSSFLFKEKTLVSIEYILSNEILAASPEKQKISIFGASIPGILFIFMSPLLMLVLIYHLMLHSRHIVNLAYDRSNQIYFNQFSWMPIAEKAYWKYDFVTSTLLLPTVSLSVLFYKLNQFDDVNRFVFLLIILSVTCIGIFSRKILVNLQEIRVELINKDT